MKDTVGSYTAKSEIDKILIEATANENWNLANSKLQVIADATYDKYPFLCVWRVFLSVNKYKKSLNTLSGS